MQQGRWDWNGEYMFKTLFQTIWLDQTNIHGRKLVYHVWLWHLGYLPWQNKIDIVAEENNLLTCITICCISLDVIHDGRAGVFWC